MHGTYATFLQKTAASLAGKGFTITSDEAFLATPTYLATYH